MPETVAHPAGFEVVNLGAEDRNLTMNIDAQARNWFVDNHIRSPLSAQVAVKIWSPLQEPDNMCVSPRHGKS